MLPESGFGEVASALWKAEGWQEVGLAGEREDGSQNPTAYREVPQGGVETAWNWRFHPQ